MRKHSFSGDFFFIGALHKKIADPEAFAKLKKTMIRVLIVLSFIAQLVLKEVDKIENCRPVRILFGEIPECAPLGLRLFLFTLYQYLSMPNVLLL